MSAGGLAAQATTRRGLPTGVAQGAPLPWEAVVVPEMA